MKLILTILCFGLLASASKAQSLINGRSFRVLPFVIEGQQMYHVSQAGANHPLLWYSTIHGGKCVGKTLTDSKGNNIFADSAHISPAFVLEKGSGKVVHNSPPEFEINNIRLVPDNNHFLLKLFATSSIDNIAKFEILQIKNGTTTVVTIDRLAASNVLSEYSYSLGDKSAIFVFNIWDSSGKYLYYSKSLNEPSNLEIVVYPTSFTDVVYINLPTGCFGASYEMYDMNGRKILQGFISYPLNYINTKILNSGSYVVKIWNNQTVNSYRVLKL